MDSSQPSTHQQRRTARACGIRIGELPTGEKNAIIDVAGVSVGHQTIVREGNVRTGVTAIIPAEGNMFQRKVPAGIFVGNGYGKLAGSTQVEELGVLETPILLTNTLSIAPAIEALVEYTLNQPGNESVRSVNAVVGETNDGVLNDIRGRHVTKDDALASLANASRDRVDQGCVGAGAGTVCFGFKGGIGTSSRIAKIAGGAYTVGCLVQTNFGGSLQIDGVPIGPMLKSAAAEKDGSCMMIVATDAPLDARNLRRLAQRAFMGLARTGGIASNGSGDYAIALSAAPESRVEHRPTQPVQTIAVMHNDFVSPLFQAAIEAAEEAIINSLFTAETTTGVGGATVRALPIDQVIDWMRRHGRAGHPL